ncbi:MAG TPA: hypothetical protein V6D10_14260 [Trichocoleus sp.]|jgi:hypothetical protein
MASPSTTRRQSSDDMIWDNLKRAIATSSGFQRWQVERAVSPSLNDDLEQQVRGYLRETLETLAY